MRRNLIIFSMFALLFLDDALGVKLGLAPGVSVKNAYLYVLCGLLAIEAAMKPGGLQVRDLDVHVPFLFLIAYAATSWFVTGLSSPSYSATKGLVTLKGQLVDLYLFFLVFRYAPRNLRDSRWLLSAILGTIAVSSVLTLMDYLDMPNLGIIGTHKGRVEGPIGEANQYGALLVFLLPLILVMLMQSRGPRRVVWLGGVLASLYLLVSTGSRGAYVAMVSGVLLGTFWCRRYLDPRTVLRWALLLLAGLLVAVLVVSVTKPEVIQTVTTKSTSGSIEAASSGRWEIWGAAIALMLREPMSFLVGFGWNMFNYSGIWKAAHSAYVDTLYELGAGGLAALLWVLFSILNSVRRSMQEVAAPERAIFIAYTYGFISYLVAIVFVDMGSTTGIVWMLTGLVLSLKAVPDPSNEVAFEIATPASGPFLDRIQHGRASGH